MVTRADVAREAGTSTAVVSYVVNDGPRPVATETRQRVLRAIERLGYRPNLIAQALRGHRSQVLGLIVPDISNPFFAELARAIEAAAEARGYTLILGNSRQRAERELGYVRTFVDRRVDGFFLVSGSSSQRLAALSAEIDVPHLLLDRRIDDLAHRDFLATDGFAGAEIATRHLLELGHRRIVALCGPSRFGVDRPSGYARAMRDAGLAPIAHHTDEYDAGTSYAMARSILANPARPTAIFAASDIAGLNVLRAAADLGLDVPGDVAVVAFDGIREGEYSIPRLTTVAQPIDELGAIAIERLASLIRAGKAESGERRIRLITPTLIIRESCGARRARDDVEGSRSRANSDRLHAPPRTE